MINYPAKATPFERNNINILNTIFSNTNLTLDELNSLIWLCGWKKSTVKNIVSAINKIKWAIKAHFSYYF